MTLKIKAVSKQGEKILKSNAKFWIIFLRMMQGKINESNVSEITNELSTLFKDNSGDVTLLKQELGGLIDLEELNEDKENLLPVQNLPDGKNNNEF